jgi:large subunit ribosomal protein L6
VSRIGRKPIARPDNVKIAIQDNIITVEGPKGVLAQQIPQDITLK